MVAENSRYMDPDGNYEAGTFDTQEAALAAARKIVDEYLASALKPGMSAKNLYDSYVASAKIRMSFHQVGSASTSRRGPMPKRGVTKSPRRRGRPRS